MSRPRFAIGENNANPANLWGVSALLLNRNNNPSTDAVVTIAAQANAPSKSHAVKNKPNALGTVA